MSYQLLLPAHILSSTVLFGTGLGTAFHGWMAQRSGDARIMAASGRSVVLADWLFTTPAVVVQPVTGIAMAYMAGFGLRTGWLVAAVILYVIVGICWLPVVWLQIRMHRMAAQAEASSTPLPALYATYARCWFWLGWPAFGSVVAIFYLMVVKPEIW